MAILQYKLTLSTGSIYDKTDQEARSFEGHFKAYLRGKIRRNRKRLAEFLIPIFQRQISRELGVRLSRSRIRVGFEREDHALSASRRVHAEFRIITYHGKHHVAKRLPSQSLTLRRAKGKTPRKRKTLESTRGMGRTKSAKRRCRMASVKRRRRNA